MQLENLAVLVANVQSGVRALGSVEEQPANAIRASPDGSVGGELGLNLGSLTSQRNRLKTISLKR